MIRVFIVHKTDTIGNMNINSTVLWFDQSVAGVKGTLFRKAS